MSTVCAACSTVTAGMGQALVSSRDGSGRGVCFYFYFDELLAAGSFVQVCLEDHRRVSFVSVVRGQSLLFALPKANFSHFFI